MKNLRIISLYKLIILALLITIGITLYRINIKLKINIDETKIIGKITNKTEKQNEIELEVKSKEKILIKTKENYNLGDTIEIIGEVEIPEQNTIPNQYSYKNYLNSKRINKILKPKTIKVVKKNKSLTYKIKQNIINYINTFKTKKYLKTFLLGDSKEINKNVKTSYQNNGISHLFAVSGMHLSMFSSILLLILKRINKKQTINYIIVIAFLTFFSFLTNYAPSIMRALILYILATINKILKLNIKNIYLIILDLILMLIYNPFYIYNTGFEYSFTITITIIATSNIINERKNYLPKLLTTSIISFVISIPISINNFHQINLLTPLINIIFVPLVSFIIFPMSLLTIIIKPLDKIFLISTNILEQLSLITEKIKINITLSHIPWYITLLYFAVIILFIKGIKEKNKSKFIPLIIILLIHTNIKCIFKITRVTAIDVGQGDSTLIENNKETILIDTGGKLNSTTSIIETKTLPFLKSLGIKKINYLVLTHGDYDHMGEAINLVENLKVEKVIFNCGEFNALETDLIKVLNKKKIPYYSCISELNIDKNKLYFLQTKEYGNENDNSNVIYTEINGYKFMFMGDAGVDKEKDILDKYNISDIDVLKVGHHGSKTSSGESFINEINPKYSIISVGKNNRYGHPNKEVLNILENSKVYRTDQDGSIMLKIKNNKLEVETCSPKKGEL